MASDTGAGLSKLWRRAMLAHRAALRVDAVADSGDGSAAAEGPEVPRFGVSASALRALLEEHRGALPAGASTADVVALVVKPATAGAPQLSYAEQLWMQRSCGTSGRAFVGPARAFVSHAWSNSFEDLVETLEAHCRSAAPQAAELGAAADGDEVLYFWVGAPPRARALLVSRLARV